MNKILIILSLVLLASCGLSQDEKENIAAITCAIMSETRNMDAAVRVEKMNDAREKIGVEPFLSGDRAIQRALKKGYCEGLVLNDTNAHPDMRPTVKEEFYSNGKPEGLTEQTRVAQDIRVINSALKFYRLDNYRYPTSSQGLEALITNPGGQDNWSGPYMLKVPIDPWGQPYNYENPGRRGKEVDIYTLGVDNQAGGKGSNADWGNWNIK